MSGYIEKILVEQFGVDMEDGGSGVDGVEVETSWPKESLIEYAVERFVSEKMMVTVSKDVFKSIGGRVGQVVFAERKPWFEVLEINLTEEPSDSEEVEVWLMNKVSKAVGEHFNKKQAVSIRKMLRYFVRQNSAKGLPEDNEECVADVLTSMTVALKKNEVEFSGSKLANEDWGFIKYAKEKTGGNLRDLFEVLTSKDQNFIDDESFLPADDTKCRLVVIKAMEIYLGSKK
jgi:hypothetical protein